jgi:hypothetical protein
MKKLMIVLLSLAFVAAFTLPSFAGDWNFYGSSRITTFYSDFNDDAGDDDGFVHTLQGNSRIGATVSGDVISGGFEYGTGVNVRKLYGVWNMGGGKLTVGQTYTPFNQFWSTQVYGGDSNLLNVGGVYAGRQPMVEYACGGFKFALVDPDSAGDLLGANLVGIGGDVDVTLPKFEAEYHGEVGAFSYSVGGVYATYEVNDEDVDAYALAAGAKATMGAFYAAADLIYGENLANTGVWMNTDNGAMWFNGDVNDEESFGGIILAGYDMGTVGLEAGYGMIASEYDKGNFEEDDESVIYAQAVIDIADGFFIVPEIGQYDYKDDIAGNDEGKMTYFGLKWQMNF